RGPGGRVDWPRPGARPQAPVDWAPARASGPRPDAGGERLAALGRGLARPRGPSPRVGRCAPARMDARALVPEPPGLPPVPGPDPDPRSHALGRDPVPLGVPLPPGWQRVSRPGPVESRVRAAVRLARRPRGPGAGRLPAPSREPAGARRPARRDAGGAVAGAA